MFYTDWLKQKLFYEIIIVRYRCYPDHRMDIRCICLQCWRNNTHIIGAGYHIAYSRFYKWKTDELTDSGSLNQADQRVVLFATMRI